MTQGIKALKWRFESSYVHRKLECIPSTHLSNRMLSLKSALNGGACLFGECGSRFPWPHAQRQRIAKYTPTLPQVIGLNVGVTTSFIMTGASLTTRTLKAKDPKLAIMKFLPG